MTDREKKPDDNHEGDPNWGGTGIGGSGYGSHEGFGKAEYGAPVEADLDRLDPPPSDDVIKEAVTVALGGQTEGDEIQVSISNGYVSLTGTVEDSESRRNLEEAAYAVPGVLKVHNLIRVGRPYDPANRIWDGEETLC